MDMILHCRGSLSTTVKHMVNAQECNRWALAAALGRLQDHFDMKLGELAQQTMAPKCIRGSVVFPDAVAAPPSRQSLDADMQQQTLGEGLTAIKGAPVSQPCDAGQIPVAPVHQSRSTSPFCNGCSADACNRNGFVRWHDGYALQDGGE
eukprot:gnl/TRDRNA2_/TRDRNA2_208238_c0_seq1.p1 gnl/TRDRNA2_/TRDRNA2_208238_c0~~gnl/TRDRNA2_/TRDRNA2_208238_c0_seq1.p1  ORF type:complete len:149 (-),score=22.09 gnl/TRDRNA2_/TRDRNA2_208238_c0_seq1:55-501(-)